MILSPSAIKGRSYRDIENVLRGTRGGIVQDKNDLLEQLRNPSSDLIIKTSGFYRHHLRVCPISAETIRGTKIIALKCLINNIEREIESYTNELMTRKEE